MRKQTEVMTLNRPRIKTPVDGEAKKPQQIYIHQMVEGTMICYLVGVTPLYINRMAEKSKQQLLLPAGRKTSGDKAVTLKHNPHEEFQSCIHRMADGAETLLGFPASAPKRAMASIAVDVPGAKKAQIGRLVKVIGDTEKNLIPVWGTPYLSMEPVRNSDMNHTPDIRTRCKLKTWATKITITFPSDLINETSILNLLLMAGRYIGLGDGRAEKGILNFGEFRVLSLHDSKEIKNILTVGRKEQLKAMEKEEPADPESAELLSWFDTELKIRGRKGKSDGSKNN